MKRTKMAVPALLFTSLMAGSAHAGWVWAKSTPVLPYRIINTAFYYDDAAALFPLAAEA